MSKWWLKFSRKAVAVMSLGGLFSGCQAGDPAEKFIATMDAAPPAERVPNWDGTRRLMMRTAPAVGQDAPDFTLASADGSTSITRSEFSPGKPQVIIFGSWT